MIAIMNAQQQQPNQKNLPLRHTFCILTPRSVDCALLLFFSDCARLLCEFVISISSSLLYIVCLFVPQNITYSALCADPTRRRRHLVVTGLMRLWVRGVGGKGGVVDVVSSFDSATQPIYLAYECNA